jgi:hypothetical protein
VHCLEILLRSGWTRSSLPEVPEREHVMIHEKSGICLVWIEPEFMMEKAVSGIALDCQAVSAKGFWLGKFPVTNGEWNRYLDSMEPGEAQQCLKEKLGALASKYVEIEARGWEEEEARKTLPEYSSWNQPATGISWESLFPCGLGWIRPGDSRPVVEGREFGLHPKPQGPRMAALRPVGRRLPRGVGSVLTAVTLNLATCGPVGHGESSRGII